MNKYVARVHVKIHKRESMPEINVDIQYTDLNQEDIESIEREEFEYSQIQVTKCFDTVQQAMKFTEKYKEFLQIAKDISEKERMYANEIWHETRRLEDKIEKEIWEHKFKKEVDKRIKTQIHMVSCSKEQYNEFLKNYPGELEGHSIYFCTPPIHQQNDYRIADENNIDSPYRSVVAWYKEGYNSEDEAEYCIWDMPIEKIKEIVSQYKGGTNNE